MKKVKEKGTVRKLLSKKINLKIKKSEIKNNHQINEGGYIWAG